MITCNCCGETKFTKEFTYTTGYGWAKHCRECGVWLKLFRQAFGKTRDVELNRERTAAHSQELYWAKKRAASLLLENVWRKAA